MFRLKPDRHFGKIRPVSVVSGKSPDPYLDIRGEPLLCRSDGGGIHEAEPDAV